MYLQVKYEMDEEESAAVIGDLKANMTVPVTMGNGMPMPVSFRAMVWAEESGVRICWLPIGMPWMRH